MWSTGGLQGCLGCPRRIAGFQQPFTLQTPTLIRGCLRKTVNPKFLIRERSGLSVRFLSVDSRGSFIRDEVKGGVPR